MHAVSSPPLPSSISTSHPPWNSQMIAASALVTRSSTPLNRMHSTFHIRCIAGIPNKRPWPLAHPLENIDVWDSRGLQTGCLRVFSGFPFWLIWLYFSKKDLIPNVADMPPIRAGVGVLKNIINVWYFSPNIILSQKYTLFRWTHGLTTNTGYFGVY